MATLTDRGVAARLGGSASGEGLTASVVKGCPPMPQSPLLTSSTITQVTERVFV